MIKKIFEYIIPFLVIPLLILGGTYFFGGNAYIYISITVAIMSCLLFYIVYEKRGKTRKLVVVAVMTALAITGRFVFAAVPSFKPVTAIIVITAIYLGSSAGFLTGSLSAFISNFYFGQGPWTPFQMLSWGIIGFCAGMLKKPLKKNCIFLSLYGAFSGVFYSVVMDFWNVLWYSHDFNLELYIAALFTSLPHTVIYAISNIVFLLFMNKPFGRKLSRAVLLIDHT